MFDTTRKYVPRPAETPRDVDAINTINTPPARPKKSYAKTMIALFLVVLAAMAVKYELMWALPVLAAIFLIWVIIMGATAAQSEHNQGVGARADQQHQLWLDGNVRGMYGEYTPEVTR